MADNRITYENFVLFLKLSVFEYAGGRGRPPLRHRGQIMKFFGFDKDEWDSIIGISSDRHPIWGFIFKAFFTVLFTPFIIFAIVIAIVIIKVYIF
jgi:hypothetical protein